MNKLNRFQKQVLEEALVLKNGALNLPMGSGKTLTSLVLALTQNPKGKVLVVCSKTLLPSWIFEIKKFFGEELAYVAYHPDYIKPIRTFKITDEQVVITTPEILRKAYESNAIQEYFTELMDINTKVYRKPTRPFVQGATEPYDCFFYNQKWGTLLVDEAQKYTKINTLNCESIASICAKNRWCLSGTLFDEPSAERILGYYLIINHPTFPRNLPDAVKRLRNPLFKGISSTLVQRNPPKINCELREHIIEHELSDMEKKIYMSTREIFLHLNQQVRHHKTQGDIHLTRKFTAYLLACLIYLRQTVVCSVLPLAVSAVEIADFSKKSQLTVAFNNQMNVITGISDFMTDVENVKSTRMKNALAVIENTHHNIVVFTCFRSVLDIFKSFISNRPVYTICGSDSMQTRFEILEQFKKETNAVLLLTFAIGAEGLNLQCAQTVLLLDFYWNDGKTKQAIARVFRSGQLARVVDVYYFISNTAIEQAVFKKHNEKLKILAEIQNGAMVSKVTTIKMKDIVTLIRTQENKDLLNMIIN